MKLLQLVVVASSILLSLAAQAEHTRITNPNALGLELLGRGMLYTLNYDRVISDDMSAGFGIGTVSTRFLNDQDTGKSATLVPAYLNYYLTRDAGSLFGSAGVTLVTNSSDVKGFKSSTGNLEFPSGAILPTFGVGYENRGDAGFLVRVTAYGVLGKSLTPWLGFMFGFAF